MATSGDVGCSASGAECALGSSGNSSRVAQHPGSAVGATAAAHLQDTAPASDQQAVVGPNNSDAAKQQPHVVALDEVRRAITCQLCHQLVASSLVLNCSHLFCGGCLYEHLSAKPQCPTCQVSAQLGKPAVGLSRLPAAHEPTRQGGGQQP